MCKRRQHGACGRGNQSDKTLLDPAQRGSFIHEKASGHGQQSMSSLAGYQAGRLAGWREKSRLRALLQFPAIDRPGRADHRALGRQGGGTLAGARNRE
jgi:hypothetical protein